MELSSVNNTISSTVFLSFYLHRRIQQVVFPLNCWSSKNLRFPRCRTPEAKRFFRSKYSSKRRSTVAPRGSDGWQHSRAQPRGDFQPIHLRFGRSDVLFFLPRRCERADPRAAGEHRAGHMVRQRLRDFLRSLQERPAEQCVATTRR